MLATRIYNILAHLNPFHFKVKLWEILFTEFKLCFSRVILIY
jgi:hypothetical protein